jgi:hypothetical protein
MSDLVERLLAAIDETERNGRLGPTPTGYVVTDHRGWSTVHAPEDVRITYTEGASERDAVLRRCSTGRRIVALHEHEEMRFDAIARVTGVPAEETPFLACVECGDRDEEGGLLFDRKVRCETLRLLADGYGITEGKTDV